MNGVLGGLVGITAGCASVSSVGAACIGFIAGLLVFFSSSFLENTLKLDDVVGAIPVHGAAGAWGTLAVGLFITPENLGDTPRLTQIWVQCLGVLSCFIWAFGVTYILIKIQHRNVPSRVSVEDENTPLNFAEHGPTLDLRNVTER